MPGKIISDFVECNNCSSIMIVKNEVNDCPICEVNGCLEWGSEDLKTIALPEDYKKITNNYLMEYYEDYIRLTKKQSPVTISEEELLNIIENGTTEELVSILLGIYNYSVTEKDFFTAIDISEIATSLEDEENIYIGYKRFLDVHLLMIENEYRHATNADQYINDIINRLKDYLAPYKIYPLLREDINYQDFKEIFTKSIKEIRY